MWECIGRKADDGVEVGAPLRQAREEMLGEVEKLLTDAGVRGAPKVMATAMFSLDSEHTLLREADIIAQLYGDDDGREQPMVDMYEAISVGQNGMDRKYARRGVLSKKWVDMMEELGVGRPEAKQVIAQMQARLSKGLVGVWDGYKTCRKGQVKEEELAEWVRLELLLERDGVGADYRGKVGVFRGAKMRRWENHYKVKRAMGWEPMDAWHAAQDNAMSKRERKAAVETTTYHEWKAREARQRERDARERGDAGVGARVLEVEGGLERDRGAGGGVHRYLMDRSVRKANEHAGHFGRAAQEASKRRVKARGVQSGTGRRGGRARGRRGEGDEDQEDIRTPGQRRARVVRAISSSSDSSHEGAWGEVQDGLRGGGAHGMTLRRREVRVVEMRRGRRGERRGRSGTRRRLTGQHEDPSEDEGDAVVVRRPMVRAAYEMQETMIEEVEMRRDVGE